MENIPHGTWSGYSSHKCRCDLCREASRQYGQARRDKQRVADLDAYKARRAEEARRYREKTPEKQAEYDRASRQRALEKGARQPELLPHGLRSTYQTFGCRCDLCKRAQWEYEQERRARDPEKYKEQNREKARRYRELNSNRAKERDQLAYYKRRETDPEQVQAAQSKSNAAYRLRSKGLTPDAEAILLEQQSGVCAICGKPDKRKLSIDHCHETGAIRGLLCRRCNLGLGCFGDDVEALKKAIEYLERY